MANGHVLLLDNGAHRRGLSYSRVVEVDPENNEIVWEYRGTPLNSFFTHFTGGAQRLANGNTLITEGANGRLFEVTPNGEVVWEYISPFFAEGNNGMANGVFRAHRYAPEDPALAGRDLDPGRYGNLSPSRGRGPRPAALGPTVLDGMVERLGERETIPGLHSHRLGHSYAVDDLRAGMSEPKPRLVDGRKKTSHLSTDRGGERHRPDPPGDMAADRLGEASSGQGVGPVAGARPPVLPQCP